MPKYILFCLGFVTFLMSSLIKKSRILENNKILPLINLIHLLTSNNRVINSYLLQRFQIFLMCFNIKERTMRYLFIYILTCPYTMISRTMRRGGGIKILKKSTHVYILTCLYTMILRTVSRRRGMIPWTNKFKIIK